MAIKPNRWLKPFKTVAQESAKHSLFIRDMMEAVLPNVHESDLGVFLELLYELCLETEKKISEPTRSFIEQSKLSGKSLKTAKNLLEL